MTVIVRMEVVTFIFKFPLLDFMIRDGLMREGCFCSCLLTKAKLIVLLVMVKKMRI